MANQPETELHLYGSTQQLRIMLVCLILPPLFIVLRTEIGVLGWTFLTLFFGFIGYVSIWLRKNPLISITLDTFEVKYPVSITRAVNLADLQCWWIKMGALYVQSIEGKRVSISLMLLNEDTQQRLFAALEALGIPSGEPQKI